MSRHITDILTPPVSTRKALRTLLLLALALRLVAAFFAKGYLMHDDHFLVVETAASWAAGEDYNNWLPWSQAEAGLPVAAHPANFAYVGVHYFLFLTFDAIGVDGPQQQALLLRLLHALYSLLIVYFGYRIASRLGSSRDAWITGLLLAALAWLPNLCVRQLVEMACIPPLLWSTWILVRKDVVDWNWRTLAWAGVGLGLATGLRYQCGMFGVGSALVLLLQSRQATGTTGEGYSLVGLRTAALYTALLAASALLVFSLTQVGDLWVWGEPFVQLRAYFGYNATSALNYPQGPPYQYLLTLLGFLIPPLSFALFFGWIRSWRSLAWVVIPAGAFFLFHSFYPNKQERFILPMLPYVIIGGVIGWRIFREKSQWWAQRVRLHRVLVLGILCTNIVLLAVLTLAYPKQSRVESMRWLEERGDMENFLAVWVDSHAMPPQFYSGSWVKYYWNKAETDIDIQKRILCTNTARPFPNYFLFYGDRHVAGRVETFKQHYPSMTYLGRIQPGRIDRFMAWLNPLNAAEGVLIYGVDKSIECP